IVRGSSGPGRAGADSVVGDGDEGPDGSMGGRLRCGGVGRAGGGRAVAGGGGPGAVDGRADGVGFLQWLRVGGGTWAGVVGVGFWWGGGWRWGWVASRPLMRCMLWSRTPGRCRPGGRPPGCPAGSG